MTFRRHKCDHDVEGGICDEPAAIHVIWEGRDHSLCCEKHKEALGGKLYEQSHPAVDACDDPAAMWFPEEETCRIPKGAADLTIGIFLVG